MKIISRIERRQGCDYFLNVLGEIVEVETLARVVGKIEKKDGHDYWINSKGEVVEVPVVKLSLEEYNKLKQRGGIKELMKKGFKIVLDAEEDQGIGELENIEARSIKEALVGATIEEVAVLRKANGSREVSLALSNGKVVKLKEGLLVGGAVLEVE